MLCYAMLCYAMTGRVLRVRGRTLREPLCELVQAPSRGDSPADALLQSTTARLVSHGVTINDCAALGGAWQTLDPSDPIDAHCCDAR